ncbi:MAG: Bifunctional riboflavin kinase/FMN adenylyltransferase [Chlamydiae bacterium]|nr:Bifunctional riboflavin kinase/FMN adenylyltransferase [Chlamydiota bacterium]
MKFSTKLSEHFVSNTPIIVTVGFFDGLHLAHQHLFNKVSELKGKNGFSYVISFSNHPKTVIKPDIELPLISTNQHRFDLIKNQNIDSLIMLPFTQELKELSPDEFISELCEKLAFTDLVVGPDSTIGKDKEGDYELLRLLSMKYSFKIHKLDFIKSGPLTISSTLIRKKIVEGDLDLVNKLLGRTYSIVAEVTEGDQQGRQMGYPTLNFDVDGLCLPPCGVYKVSVIKNQKKQLAIANLGFAPSLKLRQFPVLEVHLLEGTKHQYGDKVEVQFEKFVRPEKKFHSVDELKAQISKDIESLSA